MTMELYQKEIMRLAADATGHGRLNNPDAEVTADNPLCGDRVKLDVRVADGTVAEVGHEVRACVLCQASASIVGELAQGETPARLRTVAGQLGHYIKEGGPLPDAPFDKLAVFEPVIDHKSRHQCVLLPFDALCQALDEASAD